MKKRLWALGVVAAFLVVSVTPAGGTVLQQKRQSAQEQQDQGKQRRSTADQIVDSPLEVDRAQDQHGPTEGHLPPSRKNVKLVGQADIEGVAPERVADVSAFGNYAYLAVRDPVNCFDAGMAIMNISNPRKPRQVGFIDAIEGSFPGEGSQVLDMDTEAFTGQVLLFNNEICALGGEGGASLWDVTDPSNPQVLTANLGDQEPGGAFSAINQIHSSFAWQAGDRAFIALVDNEETTDLDILDITDPTAPVFLSERDLNEEGVLQDRNTPLGANAFLHDLTVKRINGTWTMLLSYWDAGFVLLDVDNPANPQYIDDFDYPRVDKLTGLTPSEGNAHQAEFGPGNHLIVGTDEDFSPYRIDPFRLTSGPNQGEYEAGEFGFTPPIAQQFDDNQVNGPTIYGGLGCPSNEDYGEQPPVPDASELEAGPGEEKIVVLSRGLCFFSEKIEQGQLAGYDVVIIGNHHEGAGGGTLPDASICGSQGHDFEPRAAALCIGHRAMHLIFNDTPEYEPVVADSPDMPPIGTEGARVRGVSAFDGWGGVRLIDRRNSLQEVDAYAIDEALDPDFAFGFGALSVHEVAVDPWINGLGYLAYYSGGIRVIDFSARAGITEVGHYVGKEGSNFWGVEAHRLPGSDNTLILGSDRDSGLWIFRYLDKRMKANLNGAKEVPGPGDPDGRGEAVVRLKPGQKKVCFRLSWRGVGSPTAAHIHEGSSRVAGPVEVTLFEGEQASSEVRGCVGDVPKSLIRDIGGAPRHYYVNVHNEAYPAGAIRGQLTP